MRRVGIFVAASMVFHATLSIADPIPEITPEYGTSGDGIARVRVQQPNSFDSAYVAHALPDGRLLLGGITSQLGPARTGRFAFQRLTPQGQLDPTFGFGGSGAFVLDIAQVADMTAMSTTSDGKILFAGANEQYSGVVGKVGSDGLYDSTFGQNGKRFLGGSQFFDAAFAYFPRALLTLRSGRHLVVGIATNGENACAGVARLTEQGNLDPSFDGNGTVCLAPQPNGASLVVGTDAIELDDGNILISGAAFHTGGAGFDMFVARIDPAGRLDPSFGAGGFAFVSFDAGAALNDLAHSIDVDAGGRIVIAGQVNVDTSPYEYDMGIARLMPDGSLDPSFGMGGRLLLGDAVADSRGRDARDVTVLADGRILVGGFVSASPNMSMAVMLRANGSLDAGFGSGGVLEQAGSGTPESGTLRAVPHTAVWAGDFFYFVGGIPVGVRDPIVGQSYAVAATRYRVPMFRDGFDPRGPGAAPR